MKTKTTVAGCVAVPLRSLNSKRWQTIDLRHAGQTMLVALHAAGMSAVRCEQGCITWMKQFKPGSLWNSQRSSNRHRSFVQSIRKSY